jgi:YHS domain-containing protein
MNSRKLISAIVTLFVLGVGADATWAQDQHGGAKHGEKGKALGFPQCPVTGESIDFSVKVDTKDGPVYFCCNGCLEKYKAKPEKYAKDVVAQRKAVAALPKTQVTCPITGKPIDKKVFIKHNGAMVAFCSEGCAPKFKKDPKKYAAKLADSYTYQTKCPVMGGDIDPTAFSTLPDGRKVFYCCPGCDKPFLADPARYASKLEAQGFKIDPDKIKSDKKGKHDQHDDHDSHDHDH